MNDNSALQFINGVGLMQRQYAWSYYGHECLNLYAMQSDRDYPYVLITLHHQVYVILT